MTEDTCLNTHYNDREGPLGQRNIPPLLWDKFLTSRAAGAVDGTRAQPGPGVRDVLDTRLEMPLQREQVLVFLDTGGAWGDPSLYYGPYATLGAISFLFGIAGSMDTGPCLSLTSTVRPADPTATGIGVHVDVPDITNQQLYAVRGAAACLTDRRSPTYAPSRLRSINYQYTIIRRPTVGAWHILSGGVYGTGTMLWVDTADDLGATVYVAADTRVQQLYLDEVKAYPFAALTPEWTTAYGPAISYDTFTRTSLGSTEVGAQAWAQIGTGASIVANRLVPLASGGAIVNVGQRARIINVRVTPPAAGNIDAQVVLRAPASGLFTSAIVVRYTHAGVYFYIDNVLQTAVLTTPLVNGVAATIQIIDFGDWITASLDGTYSVDWITSAHNTQYYAGLYRGPGDAGTVFDDWACYPETVTVPAGLDVITTPAAAAGAVLASDTFTDANGTLLTAHDADWTTAGAAVWEIQGNEATTQAPNVIGYAVQNVGTADVEVEADITTPNSIPLIGTDEWFCGLVARWTDINNCIVARLIYGSDREIEIWEKVGGVGTLAQMVKLGAGHMEPNTTYNVRLTVSGDELCVYLDDEIVAQARLLLLTGNKHGIATECGATCAALAYWDNWSVRAIS